MKQINKGYLCLLFIGTLLLSCRGEGEGEGKQDYTATEQRDAEVRVRATTEKYSYPTLVTKQSWWLQGANTGAQLHFPQSRTGLGADTIYADWATVLAQEKSIEVLMKPNTSGAERTISIGISQGNTGGSLSITQEP